MAGLYAPTQELEPDLNDSADEARYDGHQQQKNRGERRWQNGDGPGWLSFL